MKRLKKMLAKYKLFVGLAVLAAVAVIGIVVAQTETMKVATSHRHESFTELYFENPTNMPQEVAIDKVYEQAFTIVNREAKAVAYTYQLTETDNNGTRLRDPVTVTVESGQSFTQKFTYHPVIKLSDFTISVKLLNKNQTISFKAKS